MKTPLSPTLGLAAALAALPAAQAADCAQAAQAALDDKRFAEAATAFEIALENPACGAQRDQLTLGLATAMHRQAEADSDGKRYCDAVQKYILVSESRDPALAAQGKAGLDAARGPCDEAWKATLAITCTPADAEIHIERLGEARKCPATYEGIKAGTYQGEIRGDGRATPFIATVTPGATASMSVELKGGGGGGGEVSTWAWVTAGVAVAAFAGAGVTWLRAGQLAEQAERPENFRDYDDLKADYDTQGVLFYSLLGAGVVLGGVATWLFLDTDAPEEAPAAGPTATITPDGFGLGWQGAW
ncbi:MAG: hypothetical protein R3F65_19355 [bacterium]